MRKNKGFTLIEVMVVLSILALIAILAYNFFGSTMKEAQIKQKTTQIFNDLRVVSDACELFYNKTGSWPTDVDGNDLVNAGIIKAMPSDIWLNIGEDKGGPTTDPDLFVAHWSSDQVMPDVCKAFNAAYSQTIGNAEAAMTVQDNLASGDAAEARANTTYCGMYDTGPQYDFAMFVEAK